MRGGKEQERKGGKKGILKAAKGTFIVVNYLQRYSN